MTQQRIIDHTKERNPEKKLQIIFINFQSFAQIKNPNSNPYPENLKALQYGVHILLCRSRKGKVVPVLN
jgi:hypothetical protein